MPSEEKESSGKDKALKGPREVRAEQVRAALDNIYLGQLRTIALVMAVYYLFVTIAHFLVLDETIRTPLVVLAAISAVLSLGLHLMVRQNKLPAAWSHVAFLPPALAGTALVIAHVELSGDILQLTNGVLIMIAFGFTTLSPWFFGLLIGLSSFFYVSCLFSLGGPSMLHMGFLGLATLLLSTLCFVQRYRTIVRIERLLISNRNKSNALAEKAREARALMLEATAAAEQAEKANKAKGVFLANASHELRTPLTGVLGMMRLLEKSPLDAGQQELLGAAKFSAQTLLTLINDILDLARMEEGKLELKPQPMQARDLVSQVADLLRPTAAEKGLQLSFKSAASEVPTTLGDSIRIGQILFNLVGNAVKFTEKGRVDLSLSWQEQGDESVLLCFEVRDTGVGMDSAQIEKLFERFEQADSSSIKSQGGAGLGLSICQDLARLMGGTIRAESSPGKGSVFTFEVCLPRAREQSAQQHAEAFDNNDIEKRPLRVLLAEDNKVNQMLISKLLAPYPWELTMVSDGAAAVKTVQAQPFDLVLMDVRMPVMDGVEATSRIKKLQGEACPFIIALTANTMADDLETYRSAGMNDVVGKPIQMPALLAAIGRLNWEGRALKPSSGVPE